MLGAGNDGPEAQSAELAGEERGAAGC